MRFADLEPVFLVHAYENGSEIWRHVATIGEAQGVRFLCPVCFAKNGGNVGTHGITCWSRSRGIPDSITPGPGRWTLLGSGFADLTLGPEPGHTESVQIGAPCNAHFHVKNGEVTNA